MEVVWRPGAELPRVQTEIGTNKAIRQGAECTTIPRLYAGDVPSHTAEKLRQNSL